ncbi:protein HEG homolog 1 isoform X2 [Aotus nancymaae]|uniref:protein HEG homolog 1 isoform X2 n=1 Tax=Aotus nancymaae TaxID=37293 RepID=UPI0030FE7DCE
MFICQRMRGAKKMEAARKVPWKQDAAWNHWAESNTEPHVENITLYQNQEDISTVASKEDVMGQTSGKSHAASDAPENLTLFPETADARGRNGSSSRTNFTIAPVGYSLEIATALTSQSGALASESLHLPSSSSEFDERIAPLQAKSGTTSEMGTERAMGLSEEVTVHSQEATTSASSPSSLPALEMGELTTPPQKRNSSGPDLSWLHFSRALASSPLSDHSSSSGSTEKLNKSTGLQSPSVTQAKTMHVAVFTDGGPRTLRSLTVSLRPINKTKGFPEDSRIAMTSASVHPSPSAVESRSNRGVTGNPGDGEFIEPSSEHEFGLTSLHWQNDSPTFGEHQLSGSSEVQNGSPMSQTETVSRSVAPMRGGESTAHWPLTNSETSADVTASSASYPEGVNASVLTQFSDSTLQSGGSHTALGDKSYSESSSTSSSESLNSSPPREERSNAAWNHWAESNTEPHVENITLYQNQEDISTVASKEDVMGQTSGKSHAASDAPENLTLFPETADARERNGSSSRTNFTITPVGYSLEIATALTSQSGALASESLHLPSSSSEFDERIAPLQAKSGTTSEMGTERAMGLSEEVTVHSQEATTSASGPSSLPALEMGELTTPPQKRNSSGPDLSWLHFSRALASSPLSDHSSSSGSTEKLNKSTGLQSPSVSQGKTMHVATMFTDGGPRTLRSLTVSLGPVNNTEGFPEDSRIAMTSASVHPSPSAVESRSNRGVTGIPGDGEFIEPSTDHEFGLTSLHWQNDSPTFGEHQLSSSSEVQNGSPMSQTETVSRSVAPMRGGESTARWPLTNSETSADVTASSASYPEGVNASVLTQFSDSTLQSGGSHTALGDKSYSESSSTSSSESLNSSPPREERSTSEDSRELGRALDNTSDSAENGTSGVPSLGTHTSATVTGNGERTLRSVTLTNTSMSTTSGKAGSPAAAVPQKTESVSLHVNVTDDVGLVSQSLAASSALGVTGISYGQASGTAIEQRTSSDHTDHTYLSSTFTKGERALLSITDNSSSSDIVESSTSYIKISNSSHSDDSSFSYAQTDRSNISSYDGEYAQPSTESPVLHTSNLPSYTPTINMPNTSVVLDTDAGFAGDSYSSSSSSFSSAAAASSSSSSSSSGPPLPLPSVSESHHLFSSILPSTRASVRLLKSTSDASTPSSSSLSPLPVSLTASTSAALSVSQTPLPLSSSTPVLPRARETPVTSVQTSTMTSFMTMLHSSQTIDLKNQSTPHQEKIFTESKSPSLVSWPTESTKTVTTSSPLPPSLTESPTEQSLPATSTNLAQMSPAFTTTILKTSQPPVTTPGTLSSTASLATGPIAVQTTAGKQLLATHPEILVPQISTEGGISTERNQVNVDATTRLIPLTSVPTSAKELTTRLGVTAEYSPASHSLGTSSPQTTDVSTAKALAPKSATFAVHSSTRSTTTPSSSASVNSCATNPCLHDGECITDNTSRGYHCRCLPSWQGDDCSVDVNECLSSPCPSMATCNNTQGSFICKCPVGYLLEKGICNLVRTFMTEFKLKRTFLNTTVEKHSDLQEVENEITKMLNMCFSTLPSYIRSTVHASRESNAVVISLQTTFSLASNVTLFDLADRMQKCVNSCKSSAEVCQFLGSQRRIFRAGSLCKRKSPECDKDTSVCTDLDGVALCQCKSGYFQFNKMDHSCRACEDGYRLENETCMSCPFGLGGLNCGNPYQLITVVIAAAGGGLLLILGIALIVTCCRKNKNDISKLIFKSGDFQMSPYAEYPKNPRSQEWGREAIEMHENGSTKNLLQMTDVYYSPTGVRNPELERNGLYPAYTGLPGSRHSCIFPGQYNPSFISDESRRRDYF